MCNKRVTAARYARNDDDKNDRPSRIDEKSLSVSDLPGNHVMPGRKSSLKITNDKQKYVCKLKRRAETEWVNKTKNIKRSTF